MGTPIAISLTRLLIRFTIVHMSAKRVLTNPGCLVISFLPISNPMLFHQTFVRKLAWVVYLVSPCGHGTKETFLRMAHNLPFVLPRRG